MLLTVKPAAMSWSGFAGDDVYSVDNVGDKVIEAKNEGYDIVKSSVSYTLPNHVEELQLTKNASINGTGNAEKTIALSVIAAITDLMEKRDLIP